MTFDYRQDTLACDLVPLPDIAAGDAAPRGLRVSLGAARNRAELSQALQVLSNAVRTPVGATQIV